MASEFVVGWGRVRSRHRARWLKSAESSRLDSGWEWGVPTTVRSGWEAYWDAVDLRIEAPEIPVIVRLTHLSRRSQWQPGWCTQSSSCSSGSSSPPEKVGFSNVARTPVYNGNAWWFPSFWWAVSPQGFRVWSLAGTLSGSEIPLLKPSRACR